MLSAISRRLSGARALWRQFGLNESGSVATVLVALPVIVGTVAIGVETGQLYRTKRQMQNAADAAALAGSVEKINGRTGTITSAALYESQRNGFTDGTNGVTVTVNNPPTSGSNVSSPGAVEVKITRSSKFSLGAVLLNWMGKSTAGFDMLARSVAAQSTTTSSPTAEGCIIALTPNNEQGISIGATDSQSKNFNSFNNFATDCSIMSNGTATGTGSSASISMSNFNNATLSSGDASNPAEIWTRGSFSVANYNHFTADAINQNQTNSIYDPYASLGTPTPAGTVYTNYVEPSGSNLTMSPGSYYGGLTVQNKSNVYFMPGDYYIVNGDMVIKADNNVSCPNCTANNGVTFILTQSGVGGSVGGVSMTSENNITLNAGANNTYPGVLFYQDRRAATGTMTSTAGVFTVASLNNATLSGAIYFPQNRIDLSNVNNIGGSPTTGCSIWIGRYIKLSSYNNNYKGGCKNYGTTPAGVTTTNTRNKVME